MIRQAGQARILILAAAVEAMFFVLAGPSLAEGLVSITNAAQVRALAPEQAGQALPVRLRGVVLSQADPRDHAVVVADSTGGVYLLADTGLFSRFHRGDVLQVEGVTDPGEFAPIVKVTRANKVGTQGIPAPRSVTYYELLSGALDAQWVELNGVVRRCFSPEPGSDVGRILLAAQGGTVPIRFRGQPDPKVKEDAELSVQAVCFYQFNQKRQVLTPVLSAPAGTSICVTRPAPSHPFDAPVRPVNSLLHFSPTTPTGHRVHVRGVVTHAQSSSLVWIRDQTAGLRVQSSEQEDLKAGDEVDVLGFLAYGAYSPMLEDAIFRKTGSTQPPAPLLLTNVASAFDHEDDLIQTEATLTEIQPVLEGLAFTFNNSGTVFKGILKMSPTRRAPSDWQPGTKVRIAGICQIIYDDPRPLMGIWHPQSFQLLLRSPSDLVSLQTPPWWTAKHTIYVLGASSAALLLATGLVMLVTRRRLNEQALRRAMAESQFTAILAERNRVAREIHDTLAQGLAATSVQLRLAKKLAASHLESSNHHLDLAQQFVGESLQEARNSIWNMRSQVLETGDLASALDGILKHLADGLELQTHFEVAGRARRLAPVIENNVLRVGQEAITNAINHAHASQINVRLDFGEKHFRMDVSDDGKGFDPLNPPPSTGGFGLVGMRERSAEVKGELNIASAPGKGTHISLVVPLSGN